MGNVKKMIACVIIMITVAISMAAVNAIDFSDVSFTNTDAKATPDAQETEVPTVSPNMYESTDAVVQEMPVEVPYDPNGALEQEEDIQNLELAVNDEAVTIGLMGEVYVSPKQVEGAKKAYGYDFSPMFSGVSPFVQKADIAMINLSSPVAGDALGYSEGAEDNYIANAPTEILEAIKNAGFDVINTANGHTLDKGKIGVERTISNILEKELSKVGTNTLNDENKAYTKTIKDINIAISTYTSAVGTDIAGEETGYNIVDLRNAVNFINKEKIIEDIKGLKDSGADVIIINLCYNQKVESIPLERQKEYAELFLNEGADIIIGSGIDELQNAEVYTAGDNSGKVAVFSLGSAVKDVNTSNVSALLFLDAIKKDGDVIIENVRYIPTYNYTQNVASEILPCFKEKYLYRDDQQKSLATNINNEVVAVLGTDNITPVS